MRRRYRSRVELRPTSVMIGIFMLLISGIGLTVNAGENDSEQLQREIERRLQGRAYRWIEVSVDGSVGTLEGGVPDMWARNQAVQRAQRVKGLTKINDLLIVPKGESDAVVAEAIATAIRRYPHYTLWDHVTGRVVNGVVFLEGYVTPDRRKATALFERVARVKGVQAIKSSLVTLSPSQRDRQIRHSIARRLRNNIHFERVARMVHPPFHIVVQNGHVTLVGNVTTAAERIELQRLVAHTAGVLRVNNHLNTIRTKRL